MAGSGKPFRPTLVTEAVVVELEGAVSSANASLIFATHTPTLFVVAAVVVPAAVPAVGPAAAAAGGGGGVWWTAI